MGAAGLAGAGLAAAGCSTASAGRRLDRIGVQLYTVRSHMADSVEQTLERVAQVGYDEVEFAGYFGRSPQQIRALLDGAGLSAPSAHMPLEALENDWDASVDLAGTIGHRYLVVASIAPENRTTLDDYRRMGDRFNAVGERAQAAGLTFAYHNHAFEFEPLEGQVPWDVLLEATDPALVKIELDLYWITVGGGDAAAMLQAHPGRFHLVHVKDMAADRSMAAVGAGTLDFAAMFALREQAGIRHYFVEHDNPDDPFASIAASQDYLRGLAF
jgi:sugar phosphate isomerase/epimerase